MGPRIVLARAMGTCVGVQKAIAMAISPEFQGKLTVIGQLVHNPQTTELLKRHGVRTVSREHLDQITTPHVMITAHGAPDSLIDELQKRGFTVHNATCPLVKRLHRLALDLEERGFFVVVVGQHDHVEVQGVVGNLRRAAVVGSLADLATLPNEARIGIVSQTTNRPEMVADMVTAIRQLPFVQEVEVIDTICQPVKDRQKAVQDLLGAGIDMGIVIGGHNSSNTRKLVDLFVHRGIACHQVERAEEIDPEWFSKVTAIGITAGTSTPQEVIEEVTSKVREIAERLTV
jgi:4-hydroxy-3-methylbut-2-enyl diphosphate reductase